MIDVPPRLAGTSELVPWLNQLREAVIAARVTSVKGGKVTSGPGGTSITIDDKLKNQIVYLRVCPLDGGTAQWFGMLFASGPHDEADIPTDSYIFDPTP